MKSQRISLKCFFEAGVSVDDEAIINLFHQWIREQSVDGVLVDVADYKHVPNGPGVLLIGHDVDYGLDYHQGRAGLFIVRKRDGAEELTEAVEALAKMLDKAATQLAEASLPGGPIVALRNELEVCLYDRLTVTNDQAGFDLVRESVIKGAAPFLNESNITASYEAGDAREPLTIALATS